MFCNCLKTILGQENLRFAIQFWSFVWVTLVPPSFSQSSANWWLIILILNIFWVEWGTSTIFSVHQQQKMSRRNVLEKNVMDDIWERLLSLWHLFPFYVEAFSECYIVHTKTKKWTDTIFRGGNVKYYSMNNIQHFFETILLWSRHKLACILFVWRFTFVLQSNLFVWYVCWPQVCFFNLFFVLFFVITFFFFSITFFPWQNIYVE